MITEERAIELLQKQAQHIEQGVQGDVAAGDFLGAMESINTIREATRWVQGDMINDAKSVYGVTAAYRLAAKAMGTNVRWAIELAKVADTFPPETRRSDIPWQLYRAASLYPDPWATLEDAIANGKSADELRIATRGGKSLRKKAPPDSAEPAAAIAQEGQATPTTNT